MTKKKLPVRFTGQHFTIDKKVINTERSLLNGVPFQTIINLEKQKYNE